MALPKVCGIETEYGIVVRGAENNPVSASSLLINAYVSATSRKVGWDFDDEHPANDARGFSLDDVLAPEVETTLVNAVLTNGARYYVDHAHPEISTPEVSNAREAVVWDRAAEEIVQASMEYARPLLAPGGELVVYKNNSDGKGNSYGCHENYLLARELPFGRLAAQITPHFVTRQIFCGAGKVGCELPGRAPDEVVYQLSQRADFFEEEIGLETTLKRPIVNTRDEPHCDPQKYRRLHVIVGDANMSEVATYLKVGTTSIVLAMIEDDELGDDWLLGNPVGGDPPGQPRSLAGPHGAVARRTPRHGDRGPVGSARAGAQVRTPRTGCRRSARRWAPMSSTGGSACSPGSSTIRTPSRDWVDWVAKRRLVEGYADRHGLEPANVKLKAIDLQYHDLRAERSLARRAGLETLVDPCRGPGGDDQSADHDAGLFPRSLSRQVRQRHRRRQLGLAGLRRRARSVAAGADDGTIAWHSRSRR